jgi:hypothetical protein
MHEEHREENAADQQRRIQGIADLKHRERVSASVDKHYTAWGRALNTTYYEGLRRFRSHP